MPFITTVRRDISRSLKKLVFYSLNRKNLVSKLCVTETTTQNNEFSSSIANAE